MWIFDSFLRVCNSCVGQIASRLLLLYRAAPTQRPHFHHVPPFAASCLFYVRVHYREIARVTHANLPGVVGRLNSTVGGSMKEGIVALCGVGRG